MGKAHSGNLRERIFGGVAGGQSRRAAGRRLGAREVRGGRWMTL